MSDLLTTQFSAARAELKSYLCRLVVRPQVAEELLQTTYLRCLEAAERLPETASGVRAWLFTVASNLAMDELRRHGRWRETLLGDLRDLALANPQFVQQSKAMAGTPETKAIAREHLLACMACTLRNLPERQAAALLLKEVHGFELSEVATMLQATPNQVKNALQNARAHMQAHYGRTCALIQKDGVCHQCVELDGFLGAKQGSPLPSPQDVDARLAIARQDNTQAWGPWHRLMFELISDLA